MFMTELCSGTLWIEHLLHSELAVLFYLEEDNRLLTEEEEFSVSHRNKYIYFFNKTFAENFVQIQ